MKVLFTGGGTGGHVYPALSLIKDLKKYDKYSVYYIGSKKGIEKEIINNEKVPYYQINVKGFKRSLSLKNISTMLLFIHALFKAKKILKKLKPDVVIGTGGYVSAPVVYMANRLKIKTIIHEQNSIPGLTNRYLSKYADYVAVSFKESSEYFSNEKVVYTGNPRGAEFKKKEMSKSLTKKVLIFGGSLGAERINESFVENQDLFQKANFYTYFITGRKHYDELSKKVVHSKNYSIMPFAENIKELFNEVDLVICRAGATTLSELIALEMPSILIPSPYVVKNHQEKNADILVKKGCAIMIKEENLKGRKLFIEIKNILSNSKLLRKMKYSFYKFEKIDTLHVFKEMINGFYE